jgi:hypothetical protein
VDGRDYTPLWDGKDAAEVWIKAHFDARSRSRLEMQIRDIELANAAKPFNEEAVAMNAISTGKPASTSPREWIVGVHALRRFKALQ